MMQFWRCPKCGREFSKKNQFHSCVLISVEEHFKDVDPKLKEIFDFLRTGIEKFGQIRIDVVKTSINIGGKSHFSTAYILKKSIKLSV